MELTHCGAEEPGGEVIHPLTLVLHRCLPAHFHAEAPMRGLVHLPGMAKQSAHHKAQLPSAVPWSIWLGMCPSTHHQAQVNLWWRGGRYHQITYKTRLLLLQGVPGAADSFFPVAMPTHPCTERDLFLSSTERTCVAWELS